MLKIVCEKNSTKDPKWPRLSQMQLGEGGGGGNCISESLGNEWYLGSLKNGNFLLFQGEKL